MTPQRPLFRAGAACALFAAVLSLTACAGFFAERNIKSIEEKLNSIRNFSPTVHKPTKWVEYNDKLAAIKAVKASDPSSANTQAEELLGNVETLVTEVKSAHATLLQSNAEKARLVMDNNNGRGSNPQRYEEILAELNTAKSSLSAQDYDSAIAQFNKVISDVEQLLLPLQQEAKQELTELQNERREMTTYQAEEFAPEYITEVEQIIEGVQELLDVKKRDYVKAKQQAQLGKDKAQEGIDKANSIRAQLEISELQQRLKKARDEGAAIYCVSLLNQAETTFDTILSSFFENKFEQVLSTIRILRPTVDSLIFCTLESSSKDKLTQLNQAIQRHIQGGVEEYLPGRVDRLRGLIDAAQADFDVTSREPNIFPQRPPEEKAEIELGFERIKRQIRDAFILSEKIDGAFDDLAATALRDAEFELNVAKELFDKLEGAFIEQPRATGSMVGSPLDFNREAFKAELRQRVVNARLALDEAKIERDEDRYREAIEASRQIEREARALQNEIYRVVAENALSELESEITRFTREGATEFAATDLSLTRALTDETKALMQAKQYKPAVEQAARARAQLDVTLQVLGRSVLGQIDKARQAIEASEELRSGQFAPETVGRARSLLDQSQTQLSAEAFRRANQLAVQAEQTAKEARVEAGLAWSRSELDSAREARRLADAAEAIGYAPLLMRRAQDQYATALSLRDEGEDFAAAALTAQEAAKSFRDATNKRVNEANEAILAARRSEGWKYEQRELTKAIVRAEEANEALVAAQSLTLGDPLAASREFERSLALAGQSRAIAEEVRQASQNAGVRERLTRIQRSLQDSTKTGANYFQVAEVKRLLKETEEVKASLGYRTYDDAIEELNRIDAEFTNVLNSTPDQVARHIERLRSKLDALEEEQGADVIAPDELREARARLNYVSIDFDEGSFARAYGNLDGAIKATQAVEDRVAERSYQIEITKLFRNLNEALVRFDAVIRLGPDVLARMSRGIDGRGRAVAISNAMPPTEFKEIVDDIYLTLIGIKPPPSRESLHKRAVKAVEEARLSAAEFQKILIFDELDRRAVNESIKAAYEHHGRMVKLRSDVQERLLDAGADLDVVREEQVRPFERALRPGI